MSSRRLIAATVAAVALAAIGGGIVVATAPEATPDPLLAAVAAGRHQRIEGPHGPIHVWVPAGYEAATGATIVYVHGYFDTTDSAWTNHRLAEQFALSAANALFIVPETPNKKGVPVAYPNLGELLSVVEDALGVTRGLLHTAVLGHSGAVRTLAAWLDEPTVDTMVLIDALYIDEAPFAQWVQASPRRRLITVGEDTLLASENLADMVPGTVLVERFPPTWWLWPAEARTAQHVYVRAQFPHMALVTNGVVLPSLIRLLPLELLPTLPWTQEPGTLAPLPTAGKPSKQKARR